MGTKVPHLLFFSFFCFLTASRGLWEASIHYFHRKNKFRFLGIICKKIPICHHHSHKKWRGMTLMILDLNNISSLPFEQHYQHVKAGKLIFNHWELEHSFFGKAPFLPGGPTSWIYDNSSIFSLQGDPGPPAPLLLGFKNPQKLHRIINFPSFIDLFFNKSSVFEKTPNTSQKSPKLSKNLMNSDGFFDYCCFL